MKPYKFICTAVCRIVGTIYAENEDEAKEFLLKKELEPMVDEIEDYEIEDIEEVLDLEEDDE